MDVWRGVRNIRNGIDFPEKSLASAASIGQAWSPEVAYFVGKTSRGIKMVDANMKPPGVEVHRVPTNGRNCK
jgi:hypothetical protein